MDTITGIEPAVGLPKALDDMLKHLVKENSLKSWQIYSEKIGFTVKIRFVEAGMFTVQSRPAEQRNNRTHTVAYTRKPPCKLRRDNQRKRKIEETSPESPEKERYGDGHVKEMLLILPKVFVVIVWRTV